MGPRSADSAKAVKILVIVNIAVLVAAVAWLLVTRDALLKPTRLGVAAGNSAASELTPVPTKLSPTDTYVSKAYGIMFSYPTTWTVTDTADKKLSNLVIESDDVTYHTAVGSDPAPKDLPLRRGNLQVFVGDVAFFSSGTKVLKDSIPIAFLGQKVFATYVGSDDLTFGNVRLTGARFKKGATVPQDSKFSTLEFSIGFLTQQVSRQNAGFDDVQASDVDLPQMTQALKVIESMRKN